MPTAQGRYGSCRPREPSVAAEVPGWCKQCGAELNHGERTQGRAREFCSARCRQRHSRELRLRQALRREVGLDDRQTDRLLALFTVGMRSRL